MATEVREVEVPYYEGYMVTSLTKKVDRMFFKTREEAEKFVEALEPNPLRRKLFFYIIEFGGREDELKKNLSEEELKKLNKKKAIFDAVFVDNKLRNYIRLKKILDDSTGG